MLLTVRHMSRNLSHACQHFCGMPIMLLAVTAVRNVTSVAAFAAAPTMCCDSAGNMSDKADKGRVSRHVTGRNSTPQQNQLLQPDSASSEAAGAHFCEQKGAPFTSNPGASPARSEYRAPR